MRDHSTKHVASVHHGGLSIWILDTPTFIVPGEGGIKWGLFPPPDEHPNYI